ncbi:MAG: hypothetical protein HN356_12845 [Calditrichaeota bacterium]|jgi:hypothetical protein|nr:hypothetical protein [Calditrichota bacterium]
MFCQKCNLEVAPVADLWGNERCPTCKSLAQSAPTEAKVGADENSVLNEGVAPAYQAKLDKLSAYKSSLKKPKKVRR